tara:strand:+ start:578 stop:694 length:117 start_codon:yes stop_codon:yes gene_type:complete
LYGNRLVAGKILEYGIMPIAGKKRKIDFDCSFMVIVVA